MDTLNWPALKTYDCPRCGWKLRFASLLSSDVVCTNLHCLFKASDEKVQEILTKMTKKRSRFEAPVEEELNGLPRL